MFANINDWQSDTRLEVDGVPLDLGRGRTIILRRAGGANRVFMVALAEVIRRVVGEREPADVPDAEIDDDLKALYAAHVVVGCSGFKDADGKDVPYTRENFSELMRLAPDMWVRVRSTANTRETFQAQQDRKAVQRDKEAIKKFSRGRREWSAYGSRLADLARAGVKVPALERRPTQATHLVHVMQALADLRSERQIAVGMTVIVGPIPWRAVLAWAHAYRVTRVDEFIELVQFADATDIGLLDAKQRKPPENNRAVVSGDEKRQDVDRDLSRGLATGSAAGPALGAL